MAGPPRVGASDPPKLRDLGHRTVLAVVVSATLGLGWGTTQAFWGSGLGVRCLGAVTAVASVAGVTLYFLRLRSGLLVSPWWRANQRRQVLRLLVLNAWFLLILVPPLVVLLGQR